MRQRLVAAAEQLLADEGPSAVQARRLARKIDASTMAVYHHFGGIPDLLRAVSDEGFERLGAWLATVPATEDPITDLCRLTLAYRHAAHENKHLYELMFSNGGTEPARVGDAFTLLENAASRAVTSRRIYRNDPAQVAAQLWSVLHGYVTLELAGHFDRFPNSLTQVLLPMTTNLIVGLGDRPERASRSALRALQDVP